MLINNDSKDLARENAALREQLEQAEHQIQLLDSELSMIQGSHAYAIAQKLQRTFSKLAPMGSGRYRVLRCVWKLGKRVFRISGERQSVTANDSFKALLAYGAYPRMDIVTTRHTVYVAKLIQQALQRISIRSDIHVGQLRKYQDIPYIIICPQFVTDFPQVYFVFQMEQTVSSRWFTKSYEQILEGASGILDYATENLAYYDRPQNRKLARGAYYVPIDYMANDSAGSVEKKTDVLFYGDSNCPRRKQILEELSQHFHVKVCTDQYGEEIYREIRKAKVVVNIHYYENALLETTRLYETLSLNSALIVSEDSAPCEELTRLRNVVDFVPTGDMQALIARIQWWLTHDEERCAWVQQQAQTLRKRPSAFDFYFYRFLLAHDRLDYDTFVSLAGDYFQLPSSRVCLSLPESLQRRRAFAQDNRYGFAFVPGLRHIHGWVGCAMSYKLIFQKAISAGLQELVVCEDDILFPEGFEEKFQQVQSRLAQKNGWHLFSGMMADADQMKVLEKEPLADAQLVRVNRMISLVFNYVHQRAFATFAAWNPSIRNAQANAIDRYLEQQHLSVYIRLPFLVGHKEEMQSTIWGVSNRQYAPMIHESQKRLTEQAQRLEAKGKNASGSMEA